MIKNFKLKTSFMLAMVVGVLFLLGACSGTGNETSSNNSNTINTSGSTNNASEEKDKLVIAVPFAPGGPGGMTHWIGENLGYYEQEGLDVEIVTLPGRPAETIGMVVAGQADLAISQPDAHVHPIAEGNDQGLTWLFTAYQTPVFAIAVNDSSDITDPKQLEGKTVGMMSLGAPFETFMNQNVTAVGGDPSKVDAVAIGSGAAAMEALKSGDIEAFVGNRSEIAIAALVTDTKTRILEMPAEVAEGWSAGFIMRKDNDEKKRDAIARYIRTVVKAGIFAQENPEKAVELNWELYPASKPTDKSEEQAKEEAKVSLLETVNNYQPASDGTWGYISEERWKKFVDKKGFSDKIPDVTTLYDYSLLETINDFKEEEVREQARNFK